MLSESEMFVVLRRWTCDDTGTPRGRWQNYSKYYCQNFSFCFFWQVDDDKPVPETVARTNGYTQAEDGKTEMSLVHFTLTNPGWKPSGDNEKYLAGLKTAAERDVVQLAAMPEDVEDNPMFGSLTGLEDMGGSYRDHARSVLQRPPDPVPSPPPAASSYTSPVLRGGLSRCTGPLITSRSLLGPAPSLSTASSRLGPLPGPLSNMSSRLMSPTMNTNLELSHTDMAMSALYLHNVNHRIRHNARWDYYEALFINNMAYFYLANN